MGKEWVRPYGSALQDGVAGVSLHVPGEKVREERGRREEKERREKVREERGGEGRERRNYRGVCGRVRGGVVCGNRRRGKRVGKG